VEDIVVRHTHHCDPQLTEDAIAFSIVFRLGMVNRTVNLNDKPSFVAVEVRDETRDHLLTPKVIPQLVPS
jgi:hypothetical protein